ncbi:MAG TPA: TlyA family RNA methyltransferase [Propionibacteriaceae bacterium]|jgi:23S rRNA (cytidine1920-2'-O)/16S rRNA (cytidine1409-2'-O)-methyltransferase
MTRLDLELVDRGLARSRSHARQLITAGMVQVNGTTVHRAAARVRAADNVASRADGYVSRAAAKLLGALDDLGVQVPQRALDAGASTGGFTQVLLQRGCTLVYAIDVGTDQLAPMLRADPRVVAREQTNLRDLDLRHVDHQPVDLVVADVSFISLVLLVEPLAAVVRRSGHLLLMVKPQFEVGRELLGKGGVVRAAAHRRLAVEGVVSKAESLHWYAQSAVASRLPGPAGNREYFVLFASTRPPAAPDLDRLVEGVAPLDVSGATYAVPGE